MNDQNESADLQRTDENSQIVDISPPRTLTREPMPTGAKVAAIVPRTLEEVWRVAQMAVKSGLTPRDLNSPERATIAIMHGLEIGLKPMTALQRIAVINGRPSVWGDAVPGIALDTGELVRWDERFEGEGDERTAVCEVTRRHRGVAMTKVGRFSVAQAKQADLWDERKKVTRKGRDGSSYEKENDSPWHRYPDRMLQMRARVAFRDLFADAMCGLYLTEELVGRDADSQMRDVTPKYERIDNPLGGPEEMPDKVVDRGVEVRQDAAPAQEARGEPAGAPGVGQVSNTGPDQKPSQEAPGEAGEADDKKRRATKPADQKAAPAPAKQDQPAAGDEFPKPYVRQSAADYVEYATAWMGRAANQEGARIRWNMERSIRNNLADRLSEDQLNQLQAVMGKVGQ